MTYYYIKPWSDAKLLNHYGEVDNTKLLWILEEGMKGVGYGEGSTFVELTELADLVLVS